ncbi:MAG TPA: LysM peptidoglycan-binding domain-containing protein [Bauldia sp.]|nr:LysM peptidoglycan-binding domain-containing protein [Bauldia sp.]
MRRFTGVLALLLLIAGGLALINYDRLWPDASRTEIPSAITAGTPEGAGEEAIATPPVAEPAEAPTIDGAADADTPAAAPPTEADAAVDAPPAAEPLTADSDAGAEAAGAGEPAPGAGEAAVPPPDSGEVPAPESAAPDATAAAPVPAPAQSDLEASAPVEAPAAPAEDAVTTVAPGEAPAATPDEADTEVAAGSEPAEPTSSDVAASETASEAGATDATTTPEAPLPDAASDATEGGNDEVADAPAALAETEVALAPEGKPDAIESAPTESESSNRDSMLQAAPVPAPQETVVAAVDPDAEDEPPPATAPGTLAPGLDSETAATLPAFDVVRVEPTGDAVVAGVAPPGATVELMDGSTPVASAVASPSGDWAIALGTPLPAGQHDLGIRATSEDKTTVLHSEQRVAVLVPESTAEEPLVVLNAPDAPSTILQVPGAPEPSAADIAALDAGAPGAAAPAPNVMAESDSTETEPSSPDVEAAEVETPGEEQPAVPEPDTELAAEAPTPGSAESAVPPTLPADADTKATQDAPAPEVAAAAAPEAGTPGDGSPDVAKPDADAAEAPEVAASEPDAETSDAVAEPAVEPEPEPVVTPVVAVTAVEAETSGTLFVAGTALTPEAVRVYLDDVLLGEVTPSPSGTWLLEIKRELPAGTYRVRADQVEAGAGTVLARAEVPFEREIEVAALRPVAEVGAGEGASATGQMANPTTLIIKRRDNLWRISRQLYGKGIRWSTIYQANKDQIRNPRWIYPGQVFILPEGNVEWAEEEAGN